MRALRFTAFIALVAGLLGASAYLWAPLLSPESPRLRLAAPSLRSLVLAPLRIPPVPTGVVRRPVPYHVAGSVSVQRARLVPLRPHVHVGITAGPTPVTASPPMPPTASAATPSTGPAATPPSVVHGAAPTPTPSPKPGLPLPLPHLVVPQPGLHVKPSAPSKSSTPKPTTAPPRPTTAPPSSTSGAGSGSGSSTPAPSSGSAPVPVTPAQDQYETQPVLPPVAGPVVPAQTATTSPPAATQTTTTPTQTQTQPAPTETTPPADDTRPGWGCGDKNHTHTGPPGGSQPSPCK